MQLAGGQLHWELFWSYIVTKYICRLSQTWKMTFPKFRNALQASIIPMHWWQKSSPQSYQHQQFLAMQTSYPHLVFQHFSPFRACNFSFITFIGPQSLCFALSPSFLTLFAAVRANTKQSKLPEAAKSHTLWSTPDFLSSRKQGASIGNTCCALPWYWTWFDSNKL